MKCYRSLPHPLERTFSYLISERVKTIRVPVEVRRLGLYSSIVTGQCWGFGLSQKMGPFDGYSLRRTEKGVKDL